MLIIYSNPNCDISDTLHKIDHLMSSSHRSNILIAGDFNSSNRYWYSNSNDLRGDSLLATLFVGFVHGDFKLINTVGFC
ncbi:hypothetical protein DERF_008174 [Dermatophagoides farinae]|uniref:Endonuclease/exonuclease/phosphatase domain-containing protein n=1 Tax=Dermatophagoides farinae TaxID=6954 RepID=A0A922I1W4_DERFA|nr:hypothetical protein DERF_008174 [Dermatophagoides farinae]